jgi:membrane protein
VARSGKGEPRGSSPSDGLLTAGVLAISLVRGVARQPVSERSPNPPPTVRPSRRSGGRTSGDPDGSERVSDAGRGRDATSPSEIPARGLRDVASRVAAESKDDNLLLLAAGVAFYSVMALFPALVAVVAIYGLLADPVEVARQMDGLTSALPAEAADIIVERVEDLAAADGSSLGLSAVAGIAVALWSASSGMSWLLRALTLIYDEQETRRFVALRSRALLLTFGATVAMVVSLGLIAGASSIAEQLGLGRVGQAAVWVLRWPALALVMLVGLAVLYRYGPDREQARWRWVSWGAAVAMAVWLLASVGFAVYVSAFGSNESYGSLAGVVVLMLWLWLTCAALLLGAQIDAELERQTARDTTTGAERSIGTRGAVVADSIGRRADEEAPQGDGADRERYSDHGGGAGEKEASLS